MKKIVWMLLILISLLFVTAEDNLYLYDSLNMQLDIDGSFTLIPQTGSSRAEEVSVELFLFPQETFRQEIVELDHLGKIQDNSIIYQWNNPALQEKKFGYSVLVKTNNRRREVSTKILFPLSDTEGLEQYLEATETIDSDNPWIIAKATELAEGEDDLFKVVFKLANWVDENVVYDLSTLTADVSQQASWVLENRQGVCDEITSLFVAMARAVGIPARFATGISYSTSELFTEPWQSHGWAEVYFPSVGWVSFDITFGEYGYIDVTHIKLREGFDPVEPATRFDWFADHVELQAGELDFNTAVKNKGNTIDDEVLLRMETLAEEVSFGSYNLIKTTLRNRADYYAASTLKLAIPAEVEIIGKNKRTLLMEPSEIKETYWVIKVNQDLEQDYIYQFPIIIYSEKNVSVESKFSAQADKTFYSEEEIRKLTVKDEEKTYSRKIAFKCDYQEELSLGEEMEVSCRIKNSGNTNLKNIDYCLEGICEKIDLPINQEKDLQVTIKAEEAGWKKISISAENGLVEKKTSLQYVVLDPPELAVEVIAPKIIKLGQPMEIAFRLEKKSFSNPKEVFLHVEWLGTEYMLEINELHRDETLPLEMTAGKVSGKNKLGVRTSWIDYLGQEFTDEQVLVIAGEADSFKDKIILFFNGFLKLFY